MLVIAVALLVAVVGLIVYALSTNAKHGEIGRIMFFCGLFVTLLRFSEKAIHF